MALKILGIHDGHNCGATLSSGGKIVASVSEERLTRQKNESGYPKRSIEEVLAIGGISGADLDEVTYASNFMHDKAHLQDLKPWYCVGLEDQRAEFSKPNDYKGIIFRERKTARINQALDHLGVTEQQVTFVEHHRAHLAAAYYSAPNIQPDEKVLGLTCDGAGDGICASVSICQGNEISRISTTDRHASLGKIYSRVTMLMGMKPWEHEYKLMGMAPYADPQRVDAALEPLKGLLKLSDDGLGFQCAGELSTNYSYKYLRDSFEMVRFDTIAGATQKFVEDLLVDWVRACIKKTGIKKIVVGGGVFMNVKANMLIAEMPEVESYYVMPSAADESLSIGACFDRYYQLSGDLDHSESIFENLYLGAGYELDDERHGINTVLPGQSVEVKETSDADKDVADLLANGEIVARCCGRMEWGARSLGNRSLLASAEDFRVVEKLNKSIKQRDFWMPFAPSIRAESASRYMDDPKNLEPQFMTMAYRIKPEHRDDLSAGAHPRDDTIRPQFVKKTANPGYHRLLSLFEEKTGRGGLLNTSFNLHGEPIVQTPAEAMDVLLRSGLTHLALDHYIISKV